MRSEFHGDAGALAAHLRDLAWPHVAHLRRRAEVDAASETSPSADARLSASTSDEDWGDAAAVGNALDLGPEFVTHPRGHAALRRAGVRSRRSNGRDLWNLVDVRAAKEHVGRTDLLDDAGAGTIAARE